MSEIRVNNLSNESNTGGPTFTGITTFSSPYFFVPPVGNTAERPKNPEAGSLRFNTDSKHLEYFKGDAIGWVEIQASENVLGGGTGSNVGTGTRGIMGGYHVSGVTIEFITISTLGDSQDFGDLNHGRFNNNQNCCSETRMIWGGGYDAGGWRDDMDYITVSTLGNASDFGNLSQTRNSCGGGNDKTRAIFAGGVIAPNHASNNTMDYVTMASTGNAVDYGDLTTAGGTDSSVSSSTRGIWLQNASPAGVISYSIISTLGSIQDFGDLNSGSWASGGGSSATRGIFAGGYIVNTIQYITMATTGNAADFGDMTQARFNNRGLSSSTRNVQASGRWYVSPAFVQSDICDYIQMATTGNAVDFGDMTFMDGQGYGTGNSNGHGGLSG